MKNRYKYLVLFIFLFALFGSIKLIDSNFIALESSQSTNKNQFSSVPSSKSDNLSQENIVVEISGAVIKPGVYKVDNNTRLEDLIKLAGGIDSAKADLLLIDQTINKAQKLKDQQKIYLPIINNSVNSNSITSNNVANGQQTKIISINSASYEELITLNGIGDVTAKKIISSRFYTSLDELTLKKIVSNSLYEKIKGLIRL